MNKSPSKVPNNNSGNRRVTTGLSNNVSSKHNTSSNLYGSPNKLGAPRQSAANKYSSKRQAGAVVFSSDEDAPFLSADDEKKVDEFTKFMVTKVNSNHKNRTTVGTGSNSSKTPSSTKNQ